MRRRLIKVFSACADRDNSDFYRNASYRFFVRKPSYGTLRWTVSLRLCSGGAVPTEMDRSADILITGETEPLYLDVDSVFSLVYLDRHSAMLCHQVTKLSHAPLNRPIDDQENLAITLRQLLPILRAVTVVPLYI